MTKNKIISYKQTKLNASNIKYNDYMRTLLAELDRLGLISDTQLKKIRSDIMDTLLEIIRWWTDDESTSVMTDTANDLMMNLLFTVDAYLIGVGNTEHAVETMLETPVINLYYEGLQRLKLYVCEATGLLVRVKRTRLNIPNIYYNETIDSFIDLLKKYDMKFGSHHVPGDIDYPLAVQSKSLRGIHALRGYLMNLASENGFCRQYESEEIAKLYALFCDKRKYPYSEPRVNIFSLVFVNALFNEYLRKEPGTLMITEDECEVIESLLESVTDDERRTILGGIASKMIGGNPQYNVKTATKIMPEILNAIKNNTLKNYLICIK
ncbi:MAG: DUF6179 domain-containing protein [Eubacteriales bacterium]|nr:DUF6179 domain-containing protein [Eubacteriales bacterium]